MVVMATGLSEEKEKKALIQKLHVPSIENVLCYAAQEKKAETHLLSGLINFSLHLSSLTCKYNY